MCNPCSSVHAWWRSADLAACCALCNCPFFVFLPRLTTTVSYHVPCIVRTAQPSFHTHISQVARRAWIKVRTHSLKGTHTRYFLVLCALIMSGIILYNLYVKFLRNTFRAHHGLLFGLFLSQRTNERARAHHQPSAHRELSCFALSCPESQPLVLRESLVPRALRRTALRLLRCHTATNAVAVLAARSHGSRVERK